MMSDTPNDVIVALAIEAAELRDQLAATQELLIETAVDAGQLHAELEVVRQELATMQVERDAWRLEAERLGEGAETRRRA
jgi:hypothetical protein